MKYKINIKWKGSEGTNISSIVGKNICSGASKIENNCCSFLPGKWGKKIWGVKMNNNFLQAQGSQTLISGIIVNAKDKKQQQKVFNGIKGGCTSMWWAIMWQNIFNCLGMFLSNGYDKTKKVLW